MISNKNGILRKKTNYKPLIILGGIILLLLIIFLAFRPYRSSLADRYITSGDEYLKKYQYLEARVEYKKSIYLEPSGKAEKRLKLADEMQENILSGENFFRESDDIDALEQLNKAKVVPSSQSKGLSEVKQMIEDNQPQFAEILAETIVEMDDDSATAWMYLGIARFQSARLIQMSDSIRSNKLASAKEAFTKSQELSNGNELAQKYLDEVNKLL